MPTVMISQPMRGMTEKEILETRDFYKQGLEDAGYTVIDTFFEDYEIDEDKVHPGIFYLAKSLEKMAECDAVFFCRGWEDARGCCIENSVANQYGLKVLY